MDVKRDFVRQVLQAKMKQQQNLGHQATPQYFDEADPHQHLHSAYWWQCHNMTPIGMHDSD
jgi:hypothetical protein